MGNKLTSTLRTIKDTFKFKFTKKNIFVHGEMTRAYDIEIEAKNEDCPICLCEVDDEKPLYCGHKVHTCCLEQQIEHGSEQLKKEHISFNFLCCPLCRLQLKSQTLTSKLYEWEKFKEEVDKLALQSIQKMAEDVLKDKVNPMKFVKKMKRNERLELAYRKLLFYRCEECSKPYCGGAYSCLEAAREAAAANPIKINVDQNEIEDEIIEIEKEEEKSLLLSGLFNVNSDDKKNDDDDDVVIDVVDENNIKNEILPMSIDDEDTSYDISYFDEETNDDMIDIDCDVNHNSPIPPPPPPPPVVNKNRPLIKKEEKSEEEKGEEEEKLEEKTRNLCMECIRRVTMTGSCKHGFDELQYKCIKCCSPATFYCLGTEFYCDRCHSDLTTLYPCPGPEKCPLGVPHPPNALGTHGGGTRVIPFAISCTICGPIARGFEASVLDRFSVRYN